MKKVLIHKNGGNPVYIARCDERIYYVIYQDKSMSSHRTIGLAIANANNEYIMNSPAAIYGWLSYQ